MARTEKDTVENLINDTGLTNIEAGQVVGKLLNQEYALEIVHPVKTMEFTRKRFTDLIKKAAEDFGLVNSDYVTAEAIKQAGSLAAEDRAVVNNCRSAIGAYVRDGKISKKMYVDVGCASERALLFRTEFLQKIVDVCLLHATFQKLSPSYVDPKTIATEAEEDMTFDEVRFVEDQATIADLNGQLKRAKDANHHVCTQLDASQTELRSTKEELVRVTEISQTLAQTTLKQQIQLDSRASGYDTIVINRHRFELASEENVYVPEDMVEFIEITKVEYYSRHNEAKLIDDLKSGVEVARAKNAKFYMYIGRVPGLIRLYECYLTGSPLASRSIVVCFCRLF